MCHLVISQFVTRYLNLLFAFLYFRTTTPGPVPHLLLPIVENENGGYSWLNGAPVNNPFWNVTVPVNTGDQLQLGFSDNNRFYVTQLGPRELDANVHVVICEYVLGTECKTLFHINRFFVSIIAFSNITPFRLGTAPAPGILMFKRSSLISWGRNCMICDNIISCWRRGMGTLSA